MAIGFPEQPSVGRQLIGVSRAEPAWSIAVRAGLSVAVPASIAVATGNGEQMYLVISGSFAILFATGAYRTRARIVTAVGAILVASAVAGAVLGVALQRWLPGAMPSSWSWLGPTLFTCGYAAIACFAATAIRLRAGTATFPVMVFGGSLLAHQAGFTVSQVAGWASAGALAAVVFAVSGWLADPMGPQRDAVRLAGQAVSDYGAAVGAGRSSVHERHHAVGACHVAWRVLIGAGAIKSGRITAHPRKFRGMFAARAGSAGRPSARTSAASDEQYVLALVASQAQLRATILRGNRLPSSDEQDAVRELGAPTTARIPDPPYRYQIWRAATRLSRPIVTATRVFAAALSAGLASLALGLGRPDWAIVTVVIVLGMGPTQRSGTVKATHRMVGTAAGLALFLGIYAVDPGPWLLVGAIGLCQAMAELTIVRNYALAVIFTTPLALITGGAVALDPAPTIGARFLEVAIAVVASLVCLWAVLPGGARGTYRSSNHLAHRATGVLLRQLATTAPAALTSERQVLKYELLGAAQAAAAAAHDSPDWMAGHWPGHEAGQSVASGALALADSDRPAELVMQAEVARLLQAWKQTQTVP